MHDCLAAYTKDRALGSKARRHIQCWSYFLAFTSTTYRVSKHPSAFATPHSQSSVISHTHPIAKTAMAPAHEVVPDELHKLHRKFAINLDDGDNDGDNESGDDSEDDDDEPEFLGEVAGSDIQSNSKLPPNCTTIHPVRCEAGTLRPGSRVELDDGSFMHIVTIFRDNSENGKIYLKGNLMLRTKKVHGMLELKCNELYYDLQSTSENQVPKLANCLVTRALDDVVCIREIIITNAKFPAFSWRMDDNNHMLCKEEKEKLLKLVCRWKFSNELDAHGKRKISGGIMDSVSEEECDEGKCIANLEQLRQHLGASRFKGPQTHDEHTKADEEAFDQILNASEAQLENRKRKRNGTTSQDAVDLTNDSDKRVKYTRHEINRTIERLNEEVERIAKTPSTPTLQPRAKQSLKDHFAASKAISGRPQASRRTHFSDHHVRRVTRQPARYTYADICAGAGGMASGAQQAGLKINFLLDNWLVACQTLNMNFPGAEVLFLDVHKFCTSKCAWPWELVDILHISYPCQPHSYLNRLDIDEGNNPENIATLFSALQLLARCKPRIATLEQTSHIVTKNDGYFFRAIILQSTSLGYSVRWRVCNLAEYRNVHARKRLIIIAACPGETLPTFPEPVNGLRPGQEPLVTIRKVRKALKPHKARMPPVMLDSNKTSKPAYDDNAPLKRLITCDGGASNLHPNGKRTFQPCELAALQAFLHTHRFAGTKTAIIKQIGNAVPSCFAKILFEHITASLRETDRRIATYVCGPIDLTK